MHINCSMVTYQGALVRNYLEACWPCAGGLSAVNAIGTQLHNPMNSGLTRWRMTVLNKQIDATVELGRNPASKYHTQHMEMSRLAQDGTAEPVSRDKILRREHGQGNLCSADHEQDWQSYPVDTHY